MLADHQLVDPGPADEPRANSSTTIAPPPMTSTRPSCIGPSAARWSASSPTKRSHTDSSRRSHPRQMDRLGVVGGHRCASADSVVIVPATPTQVRARSTGTARSASPALAHHLARGRDLDGGRRVGMQAPFGQPHAADVRREAGLDLAAHRTPSRSSHRRGRRRRKALRHSPIRRPRHGTTARPPRRR